MESSNKMAQSPMSFNVKYYPIYRILVSMMAWLPIFFLFFNAHLELKEVLLLESFYYISVVLLEVPSGYFSDRVGRKTTLIISSLGFASAYLIFGFTEVNFVFFALAQVGLAIGMSFMSGTNTAFYFESLKEINREDEFPEREAKIQSYTRYGASFAMLLGGFAGSYQLNLGYVASLLFILPALIITFGFKEPTHDSVSNDKSIIKKFVNIANYLKQAELRWVFVFSVIVYVLIHIPYELYQPYLRLLSEHQENLKLDPSISSGILMALTSIVAGYAAAKSIVWTKKFGLKWMCYAGLLIQIIIISTMGLILHPLVIILILFRSVSTAMTAAPINAIIAPRVNQNTRATYFSFQSLVSRMLFSATLVLLSFRLGVHEASDWPSLSTILLTAAIGGVIFSSLILFFKSGDLFKKPFANS